MGICRVDTNVITLPVQNVLTERRSACPNQTSYRRMNNLPRGKPQTPVSTATTKRSGKTRESPPTRNHQQKHMNCRFTESNTSISALMGNRNKKRTALTAVLHDGIPVWPSRRGAPPAWRKKRRNPEIGSSLRFRPHRRETFPHGPPLRRRPGAQRA